ncbi:MAG: MFS transporter [Pseudomonadota bacterium]
MSDSAVSPIHDDAKARRVVIILVWAQSVLGAQMPVHIILGPLVGKMLAEDPALATLPISMTMLVTMFAAPAMSAIMGRWGRRTGFILGALCGILSSALAVWAIETKDFQLFCIASAVLGVYMGGHGFYRFAATDLASAEYRPKAISWVMAGGLMSAIIGPELAKQFDDWLAPIPYAGAYQISMIVAIIGVIPLFLLEIPVLKKEEAAAGPSRSWGELLTDRTIVVAMLCGMVAYALMNLAMTSTPLAMEACGFISDDSADVVRIHVLLMFAPSFFTGALIARFGAVRIIAVGLGILALCAIVALMGITFFHFAIALGLLGVGWNFGFIGATALLAAAHSPAERTRVQGLNDFLVFGLVTVASFSSGALMHSFGWDAVNMGMFPAIALAVVALGWLVLANRRAAAQGV